MNAPTLQAFEEPRLHALVELLYLAAMADGELSREELSLFRRRVQSMTDERLGEAEVERLMLRVDGELMAAGRDRVLASVGKLLGEPSLQRTALSVALDMMMADKVLKPAEREFYFELAEVLGMDEKTAEAILIARSPA
jgi:tellurite resistance protein